MAERWRQGRKVTNHVYAQTGAEPSGIDRWVGSFPSPDDAARAVAAVNWGPSDVWVNTLVKAANAVVRREGPVSPSTEVAQLKIALRAAAPSGEGSQEA